MIHDLVDTERQRWMAAQRATGALERFPDLVIDVPRQPGARPARRCLILGDPGEADPSQYAVVDPMLDVDRQLDSDFMVVLSDVIYPAGDVNDYVNGFYEPYAAYEKAILALPGNHDWYDGLNGFMFHFCGAEALPPTTFRGSSYSTAERLARWLWRRASRPDRPELLGRRFGREESWAAHQPGPYWAIDLDGVRLVGIDTGIKGTLDREQGEWLLRVSRGPWPKVLLTGKPLWANGEYRPTPIDWGRTGPPAEGMGTVDDIVRAEAHRYVAAVGGDVHNYQRLTVTIEDGPAAGARPQSRRIEYIVAGGSGAYMSATHRIGRLGGRTPKRADPEPPESVIPPTDADFRCYPMRGDSLAYYAHWYGTRLVKAFLLALVALVAAVTATVLWAVLGDGLGEQSLLGVMAASLAGFLLPVLAALAGWGVNRVFPEGYRTVGVRSRSRRWPRCWCWSSGRSSETHGAGRGGRRCSRWVPPWCRWRSCSRATTGSGPSAG